MVLLPSVWLTYQLGSSVSPVDNISVDVRNTLRRVEKKGGPLNRNDNAPIVCQLIRLNCSNLLFYREHRNLAHEIFKEISRPCIFWC